MIQTIFIALIWAFLGYVIGRIGHYYLNVWMGDPNWLPHHWIYGVLLMGASFLFGFWGFGMFWLGLGLFVSDFKDFLELKTFEPDGDGPKRFWHID